MRPVHIPEPTRPGRGRLLPATGKGFGRARRYRDVASVEFSEFYEGARHRCLSAVLVTVRDPNLAEELVAEAFARAWARWDKLAQRDNPSAWVVRTALNLNVSRWRRQRHETPLARHHWPSQWTERDVDPAVMNAVLALPRRQREVVALRIVLDLDAAATAKILKIAPATVGVHLHRALTALQAALILEERP